MRSLAGRFALAACLLAALLGEARSQDAAPLPARLSAGLPPTLAARPDMSATDIAKQLQNPLGDLINIPIQSNTNLLFGPNRGTQEVINIQPVVPFHISETWNIITRTILALGWNPSLQPSPSVPFGMGNTVISAFLSPRELRNGWLWGAGPVVQLPTASNPLLGSSVWGGGPTAALVYMEGPWVAGALVNNIWSFGGTSGPGATRYNTFSLQPGAAYNFEGGFSIGTTPAITANWLAAGKRAWTLPVGGQIGQVVTLGGSRTVSFSLGAYYNALRPAFQEAWQITTQVTFVF